MCVSVFIVHSLALTRELKQAKPSQYWPGFIFKYPTLTTAIVVGGVDNLTCMKGKKDEPLKMLNNECSV